MATLKLNSHIPVVKWCSLPPNWLGENPNPKANTWVKLLDRLNTFAHDEALLLCQKSEFEWVAWVPDHGEACLDINQFCVHP